MTTKFAVFGSGCIGACVGISLASTKYDVSFIGRNSEKFETIQRRGTLSLQPPESDAPVQEIKCDLLTTDAEVGLRGRQVIFVATKRTANQTVADSLVDFAEQGALVVLLQNGLDTSQLFYEIFNKKKREDLIVFEAVVNFNVVELSPGNFAWISKRNDSCVAIDGTKFAIVAEEKICSTLRSAGVDSYADRKFIEVATGKLLINLINAPSKLGLLSSFSTTH